MRTAGIRDARQRFSDLLEEVKRGGEIEITDRGRVVAKLTAPDAYRHPPFKSRAKQRGKIQQRDLELTNAITSDRDDRA